MPPARGLVVHDGGTSHELLPSPSAASTAVVFPFGELTIEETTGRPVPRAWTWPAPPPHYRSALLPRVGVASPHVDATPTPRADPITWPMERTYERRRPIRAWRKALGATVSTAGRAALRHSTALVLYPFREPVHWLLLEMSF